MSLAPSRLIPPPHPPVIWQWAPGWLLSLTGWMLLISPGWIGSVFWSDYSPDKPVLKPVPYASTISSQSQEKVNKGLVVLLFKQLDTAASFVYTGNSRGDTRPLLPTGDGHTKGPPVSSSRSAETVAGECFHDFQWRPVSLKSQTDVDVGAELLLLLLLVVVVVVVIVVVVSLILLLLLLIC